MMWVVVVMNYFVISSAIRSIFLLQPAIEYTIEKVKAFDV